MPGEALQEKGRKGARLAKKWLDRTTRVDAKLVNPDEFAVSKLTINKAQPRGASKDFSFDLGGFLRGEELEGQGFLAECKNYDTSSDLGTHYKLFLAHCYRAAATGHILADNFFFISFAPFNVTIWDTQRSVDTVRSAVLAHREVNFLDGQDPQAEINDDTVKAVSDRLWILILSEEQVEKLIMTAEHHGVIEQYIVNKGGGF